MRANERKGDYFILSYELYPYLFASYLSLNLLASLSTLLISYLLYVLKAISLQIYVQKYKHA